MNTEDRGDEEDGDEVRLRGDRLRYDEGRAIAERLEQIGDDEAKESFDEVFAEFDTEFSQSE